jgi:hypothetical protein
MLSVVMLSVAMLSVVMLSAVMLSAVMLSVVAPKKAFDSVLLITTVKSFLVNALTQSHKTFYGCNLLMFVIS